jgi:hypothetical protein
MERWVPGDGGREGLCYVGPCCCPVDEVLQLSPVISSVLPSRQGTGKPSPTSILLFGELRVCVGGRKLFCFFLFSLSLLTNPSYLGIAYSKSHSGNVGEGKVSSSQCREKSGEGTPGSGI